MTSQERVWTAPRMQDRCEPQVHLSYSRRYCMSMPKKVAEERQRKATQESSSERRISNMPQKSATKVGLL